jgi:hypothetical protein
MKQRLAFMAVILLVALAAAFYFRTRPTRPSITYTVAEPAAPSNTLPPPAVSAVPVVPPVAPPAPARTLPAGWEGFLSLKQGQQLNRVTAAMDNHTLPADVLAFFEKEILNRDYWPVTRNNMANALVWQETPNPRLHELFMKMLEDQAEDPVWRDYCLQFLSECMASSSDPDAIKAVLSRYSKGKDGLAGTAIVNLAFQEGKGRLQNDESFSQQLEAQLADPEVDVPTRMSILGVVGKRHDTRMLPLVRTCATNSNDGIKRCALGALGQIGEAEDLPTIRADLTHRNRAVQLAAKAAEGRLQARLAARTEVKEQQL